MNYKIYSVFDSASDTYGIPYFTQNHIQSKRLFARLVNDPNSMVSFSPRDFALYFIGEFDDESAKLITLGRPELIIRATEVKKEYAND